jgi:hypothetical protein
MDDSWVQESFVEDAERHLEENLVPGAGQISSKPKNI